MWAFVICTIGTLLAIVLLFVDGGMRGIDAALLGVFFVITGLGLSAGLHRYFSHRSYKFRSRKLELGLAVAGTAGGQGHFLRWVHDHRIHHQYTDGPGDPHSPHCRGDKRLGRWAGLYHAHIGWLFDRRLPIDPKRVADYVSDSAYIWIDRHSPLITAIGVMFPGIIAYIVEPTAGSLLRGALWGGVVRMFLLYHLVFLVNSVGHAYGPRLQGQVGEARNNVWLGPILFGDGWHANHHAHPRSARHGWGPSQFDPNWLLISLLARVGVVERVIVAAPNDIDSEHEANSDPALGHDAK